jgi:Tfp pilus assembly protein PilN
MDFAGTPNTSSPTTVLLIATNRDVLDQCMVMAKSAGLRVHGITSTTAALGRATSRLPGGNGWVLHVGQTGAEVVVQHGQDPAHLRHLNVPDNGSPEAAAALAGEIRRMMAAIPKNGTPMTLAVWRGPSENGQAGQGNILEQRLSMPVTTPDLDKLVATDSRDANAYAPAVAVALSAVEPAGLPVDFLHSRLAPPTPPRISPAKQLAIVGGVLAVLLVGGAVFHLNSKDRQLNDLVTKNKANETKVKNALTDESRLKEAQLWIRNGPHFVAVLRDISRLFPTQSNTVWATRLNNMRDIDSWEISGKTTSEQQARALLNSFLQSDRFSNAKLAYVQEDQAQAGRGNQQLYTFRIQFTYHGE